MIWLLLDISTFPRPARAFRKYFSLPRWLRLYYCTTEISVRDNTGHTFRHVSHVSRTSHETALSRDVNADKRHIYVSASLYTQFSSVGQPADSSFRPAWSQRGLISHHHAHSRLATPPAVSTRSDAIRSPSTARRFSRLRTVSLPEKAGRRAGLSRRSSFSTGPALPAALASARQQVMG